LAIIYFNLVFGIRYSIYAAVLAGILKDSFGADIFGVYTFSFVVCAYMTTVLKKYLHYVASRRSRLLLVFFIILINIVIHLVIRAVFTEIDFVSALKFVFVPEICTTLLVTSIVFTELKRCASKLFV
jgi:rod shape-determining protein MreD